MRISDRHQNGRGRGPTRRDVLRAAAVVTMITGGALATGCDLLDRDPSRPEQPDPLAPLLAEANALAAQHEAAVAAFPELGERLRPVAEAHRAHAAELARVTGATSSASPGATGSVPATPATSAAALAGLRAAEQRGREAAVTACLAAPPNRAVLVGSIAAARATHLEVLR